MQRSRADAKDGNFDRKWAWFSNFRGRASAHWTLAMAVAVNPSFVRALQTEPRILQYLLEAQATVVLLVRLP